ncbi:MAG: hypothetical protein K8J08_19590 [Thermoanaerobaculia bacterium]|nr:hypothetical protein [Thermoanaerobaculia bacterium]
MRRGTTIEGATHEWRGWADHGLVAVLAALLVGTVLLATPGFAGTLRVGSDPIDCDYTDLASAILAAVDGDELLLETMEFAGASGFNFNITSIGLTIRGGYEDCSATVPTGQSILRGGGADTVVEIRGPSAFPVWLENLIITGGEDDVDDGGGVEISGDIDVILLNVYVVGNSSDRGGGVFIDGSLGATLSTGLTLIDGNTATIDGGGIYCQDDGLVQLNAHTQLLSNSTSGNGGGVWLGSGCDLDLFGSLTGHDNFVLVQDNLADGDGGGLYVDGATVYGTGGAEGTLWISHNTAGKDGSFGVGGGVYITGDQARLDLDRGILFGNRADQGGGFYAQGATVEVSLTQSGPCSSVFPNSLCSEIGSNHAPFAAGMVVVDGAFADIELTMVQGNSPEGVGEAPIGWVANGGELILEGALIFHNGISSGSGSGVVDTGGRVQVYSSTLSDNYGLDELFWVGGDFHGQASLFETSSGDLFAVQASGDWSLDCAVVGPGLSLPPGGTRIVQAALGLVDPAHYDYHLAPNSPAIDLCNGDIPGVDRDIDYGFRPLGSALDAGADEYDPPLFRDGFESGNLTGWSSS